MTNLILTMFSNAYVNRGGGGGGGGDFAYRRAIPCGVSYYATPFDAMFLGGG